MAAENKTRPKASAPWKRSSLKTKLAIAFASVAPSLIAFLAGNIFSLPGLISLVGILLPLQLIAAMFVGNYVSGRHGRQEAVLMVLVVFFSAIVVILLGSVLWSVISNGAKVLSIPFLIQNNNYITPTTELGYGGLGHALLGSLEMTMISSAVTVPLGILVGVYLTETRDKSRTIVRTFVQSLAGLPSVVAGLFIYSMFVVTGVLKPAGILGSLALIPLMLPTVARVVEESLKLVPQDLRSAAIGLGASKFKAFMQVTLPAARSGIITAVLLGIARILGETAPILLTTLMGSGTNLNVFQDAFATLPTYLFNNLANSTAVSFSRAWGTALVMMMFVGAAFVSIRIISRNRITAKKK
jgi:phosphate transport system permease protein